MEKNYRVHTNISSDTVLKVNLKQDFDFLEILSLKINQEDTYRLDTSNYGIIVGRVLANDAFGIPNARVSLFFELSEDDSTRSEILNIYNYKSVQDKNADNIRYNLLPDDSDDDCYRIVGTFPTKRLVLDDNTVLEVFEKYYKYTTVTNNSGDYMIYGVPTGSTQIHVDIDLSDIGILSQKPRDFMYKGYTETLFDNSEQFKESTNLDNLAQIISQNQGLYVYPFISEDGAEDAAITRCDVQVQYKFEPTCVFFGSVISDSFGNNIEPTCSANRYIGRNSELIAGEGTIEMIRKTIDGLTEEYQIQGNQLIDNDGVWCYQIPMNLDYVGTDEFGNIVATDNPNKGIPTRTRVRFRFSMAETESDSVSRHRAKYLVPNNPIIEQDNNIPSIKNCVSYDKHFNFGSATQDEDFRDLYWNKVYSVKNYIPRLQTVSRVHTYNYTGIRTVNKYQDKNPFPFNKGRFRLPFAFMLLCVIVKVVIWVIKIFNTIQCVIYRVLKATWILKSVAKWFKCIPFGAGLTDSDDSNKAFYPGCSCANYSDCPDDMEGCKKSNDSQSLFDIVEQALAQEYDVIHLDFYNDWVNGTLYLPLWHWKKTRKKSYFFGLFRKKAKNLHCDCDVSWERLRNMDSCTLTYTGATKDNGHTWHKSKSSMKTNWGIVKNVQNKDGLNVYYYSPGVIVDSKPNVNQIGVNSITKKATKPFARYFATDIILLGSFNDCDTEGLPQPFKNLPPTTSHIPPIARVLKPKEEDDETSTEGTTEEEGTVEISGMDWLHDPTDDTPYYGKGLLFGIDCTEIYTKPKSCVNLGRMSELGVNLDMAFSETYSSNPGLTASTTIFADGVINKIELEDYETRAMFATLNHRGLNELRVDPQTGYKIYNLRYIYPVDFDGRQRNTILKQYYVDSKDYTDNEYLLFKYGPDWERNADGKTTNLSMGERITHNYSTISDPTKYSENNFFPLYNNSFYFYFGLHEGKTAIEKFRRKFTSTCFKNKKYPFTIDVSKLAAKWCQSGSETDATLNERKCGIIDISLPNIKMPYSYTLSDQSTGDLIIKENNVSMERLIFGVKMSGNQQYEYGPNTDESAEDSQYYQCEDGNYYIKTGIVTQFTDVKNTVWNIIDDNNSSQSTYVCQQNQPDGYEQYHIQNGVYVLNITDSNGNTESVSVSLNQQPISLNYTSASLGSKFMPLEDIKNKGNYSQYTTSHKIYDKSDYGEIVMTGVTIDGDQYNIDRAIYIGTSADTETMRPYDHIMLYVSNDEYEYQAELKIYVNAIQYPNDVRFNGLYYNTPETWSFLCDCCDGGNNGYGLNYSGTKDLSNSNERPKHDSGDPDYDSSTHKRDMDTAGLEDGTLFFYPFVPGTYDFIITQICGGETNNNSSTSSIRIDNGKLFDAFLNDVPLRMVNNTSDFWYNVNCEDAYAFPSVPDNQAIWSEYIDYSTVFSEDGTTRYCDSDTKLNALMYKFKSMFELSKAVFFTDSGFNNFDFTIKGGKNTIKQAFYPEYNDFTEVPITFYTDESKRRDIEKCVNYSVSRLNSWSLTEEASLSCDSSHPNIVAYNYKVFFPNVFTNKKEQHAYMKNSSDNTAYTSPYTIFNKSELMPFVHLLPSNPDDGYGFNTLVTNTSTDSLKINNANYFAAFTNNGGLNGETQFERFPDNSNVKPITSGRNLLTFTSKPNQPSSAIYYNKLRYWFKAYFIDMRIGYRAVVMTSSPSLLSLGVDENDQILKGRFALQTIGGMEMAYTNPNDDYFDSAITVNVDGEEVKVYGETLPTSVSNYNIIQKINEEDEQLSYYDMLPRYEYYYLQSELKDDNQDIHTYCCKNYDYLKKYFYTANISTNSGIYDIRGAMVNSSYGKQRGDFAIFYYDNEGNKIVSELNSGYTSTEETSGVSFHKESINNKTVFYNGYYDGYTTGNTINKASNYPIKRYTDIVGLDIRTFFEFDISSASYEIDMENNYGETDTSASASTLNGIVNPTDELAVSIGCNQVYQSVASDVESCEKYSCYDVLCSGSTLNTSAFTFNPILTRICVTMPADYYASSDLDYAIFRPFMMFFNGNNAKEDLINLIRTFKLGRNEKTAFSPYDTYEALFRQVVATQTGWAMRAVGDDGTNEMFWNFNRYNTIWPYTNNDCYKFLAEKEHEYTILRDEYNEYYDAVMLFLEGSKQSWLNTIWKQYDDTAYNTQYAFDLRSDNVKYMLLFGGREYHQESTDLLIERDVRLFDFSNIYTFDSFTISNIFLSGEVESGTTSSDDISESNEHLNFEIEFDINDLPFDAWGNEPFEVGCRVWCDDYPLEVSFDKYASIIEESGTTYAHIKLKGSSTIESYDVIKESDSATFQFFFKHIDGLCYGCSCKIGNGDNRFEDIVLRSSTTCLTSTEVKPII